MPNGLGKLPTPLEVVDTVADVANQVVCTPARVGGNALTQMGQTLKNIEGDISRPREFSEIPPPPDVLVEPAVAGVSHIVEGAIATVKGAFDGVVKSADGIRNEITQSLRR